MNFYIRNKKRNIFYHLILFLGLFFMIWEISIYRKTIIPIRLLIILIFSVGSLATILDFKNIKNTYDLNGSILYFLAFAQNILSWGFLACSILVLSNYYFSEGEIKEKTYKIVERSSMPGYKGSRSKRTPLVRINYEGKMKSLVFPKKYYGRLDDFKYVDVSIQKGFLFWDIIINQELKK